MRDYTQFQKMEGAEDHFGGLFTVPQIPASPAPLLPPGGGVLTQTATPFGDLFTVPSIPKPPATVVPPAKTRTQTLATVIPLLKSSGFVIPEGLDPSSLITATPGLTHKFTVNTSNQPVTAVAAFQDSLDSVGLADKFQYSIPAPITEKQSWMDSMTGKDWTTAGLGIAAIAFGFYQHQDSMDKQMQIYREGVKREDDRLDRAENMQREGWAQQMAQIGARQNTGGGAVTRASTGGLS